MEDGTAGPLEEKGRLLDRGQTLGTESPADHRARPQLTGLDGQIYLGSLEEDGSGAAAFRWLELEGKGDGEQVGSELVWAHSQPVRVGEEWRQRVYRKEDYIVLWKKISHGFKFWGNKVVPEAFWREGVVSEISRKRKWQS